MQVLTTAPRRPSPHRFVLPSLTAPPDLALVDCAELLEDVRRADGGAARLDALAEDGLLMREGDGRVSRWQSAGAPLQAALLSLAEAGALSTAEAGAAAGDPLFTAAAAQPSAARRLSASGCCGAFLSREAVKAGRQGACPDAVSPQV